MEKKTVRKKNIAVKSLKDKLLAAVNRVLSNNHSELTNRMEKIVKKSIKPISRRAKKQLKSNNKQTAK